VLVAEGDVVGDREGGVLATDRPEDVAGVARDVVDGGGVAAADEVVALRGLDGGVDVEVVVGRKLGLPSPVMGSWLSVK
jgi:hypothetical protein